jgi:tetratricopeptide (TPR) repeat protein
MNRKQYIASLIILGVGTAALFITNYFFQYMQMLYIPLIVMLAYVFIKYKVTGPLQMFANKFSMLVDYDLEVEQAVELSKKGYENAPTQNIKALYQLYYGMGLYYAGQYEEAIKMLNTIDLRKLQSIYHILIFAFVCYCCTETKDWETFRYTLDRIKTTKAKVGARYQSFANNYVEILEAIQNAENDPEHYKEVVEKHFNREDGFISTKLVYNYRLSFYHKALGNDLEADKCLAFVIANGKNHHTALRAKELFKNLVNVEDYVYVVPNPAEPLQEEKPEVIESQTGESTESEQTEEVSENQEEKEE